MACLERVLCGVGPGTFFGCRRGTVRPSLFEMHGNLISNEPLAVRASDASGERSGWGPRCSYSSGISRVVTVHQHHPGDWTSGPAGRHTVRSNSEICRVHGRGMSQACCGVCVAQRMVCRRECSRPTFKCVSLSGVRSGVSTCLAALGCGNKDCAPGLCDSVVTPYRNSVATPARRAAARRSRSFGSCTRTGAHIDIHTHSHDTVEHRRQDQERVSYLLLHSLSRLAQSRV
jgi:hypothetical protein